MVMHEADMGTRVQEMDTVTRARDVLTRAWDVVTRARDVTLALRSRRFEDWRSIGPIALMNASRRVFLWRVMAAEAFKALTAANLLSRVSEMWASIVEVMVKNMMKIAVTPWMMKDNEQQPRLTIGAKARVVTAPENEGKD